MEKALLFTLASLLTTSAPAPEHCRQASAVDSNALLFYKVEEDKRRAAKQFEKSEQQRKPQKSVSELISIAQEREATLRSLTSLATSGSCLAEAGECYAEAAEQDCHPENKAKYLAKSIELKVRAACFYKQAGQEKLAVPFFYTAAENLATTAELYIQVAELDPANNIEHTSQAFACTIAAADAYQKASVEFCDYKNIIDCLNKAVELYLQAVKLDSTDESKNIAKAVACKVTIADFFKDAADKTSNMSDAVQFLDLAEQFYVQAAEMNSLRRSELIARAVSINIEKANFYETQKTEQSLNRAADLYRAAASLAAKEHPATAAECLEKTAHLYEQLSHLPSKTLKATVYLDYAASHYIQAADSDPLNAAPRLVKAAGCFKAVAKKDPEEALAHLSRTVEMLVESAKFESDPKIAASSLVHAAGLYEQEAFFDADSAKEYRALAASLYSDAADLVVKDNPEAAIAFKIKAAKLVKERSPEVAARHLAIAAYLHRRIAYGTPNSEDCAAHTSKALALYKQAAKLYQLAAERNPQSEAVNLVKAADAYTWFANLIARTNPQEAKRIFTRAANLYKKAANLIETTDPATASDHREASKDLHRQVLELNNQLPPICSRMHGPRTKISIVTRAAGREIAA